MFGITFYEWCLKNPNEAITVLVIMIGFVALYLIVSALLKYKEKIHTLQCEIKILQSELKRESDLKNYLKSACMKRIYNG